MEKIHIALACDERYMPGLIGTVTSLLTSADNSSAFAFYILDGGIKNESIDQLKSIVARFVKDVTINIIMIDTGVFNNFPSFFFESKMTYARILLPSLLSIEKVIYIDTDILVLKDITQLWKIELTTHAAVCTETVIGKIKNDCPIYQDLGLDGDAPYFNAGLMFMNLNRFREDQISEKTFDYLHKYHEYCKFHDQSALNVTLYNKLTWLSSGWNTQAHKEVYNPAKDLYLLRGFDVNFHFVTSNKPWLTFVDQPEYNMYYTLLNCIGYPLVEKSFLKKKCLYQNKISILSILPAYYGVLSTLYRIIGNKKKADTNKKISDHWQYIKGLHKVLSKENKQVTELLETWKTKIQTKLKQVEKV